MVLCSLKSSGYLLEEMVCSFRICGFLAQFSLIPTGPFHAGFMIPTAAHEEVMQKAAELQGCPIAGPCSLEGHRDEPSP